MDYTVGSVADLITGSNTPNKSHVVKKVISQKVTPKSSPSNGEISRPKKTPNSAKKSPKLQKPLSPQKNIIAKKSPKKSLQKLTDSKSNVMTTPSFSPDKKTPKRKRSKSRTVLNDSEVQAQERSIKMEPEAELEKQSPKKMKTEWNAERRIKNESNPDKQPEDPEVLARTVFVGNVPVTETDKTMRKLFSKYGAVESVRIRGVTVADPKMSKKVAFITKKLNPKRNSFFAYIKYKTVQDALNATSANGLIYNDHHLRVHKCDVKEKPDESKAIFVGNLSFGAEEDDLWKLFESCGAISSVRIVRDNRTGMGKGFGYVNFENSDSVHIALEMQDVKLNDRELRISPCNVGAAAKNKKEKKIRQANNIKKAGKQKIKKPKKEPEDDENTDEKKPIKLESQPFQGVKSLNMKKKKKENKGLIQKKKMAKKLLPNTK